MLEEDCSAPFEYGNVKTFETYGRLNINGNAMK